MFFGTSKCEDCFMVLEASDFQICLGLHLNRDWFRAEDYIIK